MNLLESNIKGLIAILKSHWTSNETKQQKRNNYLKNESLLSPAHESEI